MSNLTEVPRKFAVTITLKSGVQLRAECDEFSVARGVRGNLRKLEWENLSARWLHVDPDDIAAIVCVEIMRAPAFT